MTKHHFVNKAYVTENGDWSANNQIIVFDPKEITRQQWENLDNLPDYAKLFYVREILCKNKTRIKIMETEYGLPTTAKETD